MIVAQNETKYFFKCYYTLIEIYTFSENVKYLGLFVIE